MIRPTASIVAASAKAAADNMLPELPFELRVLDICLEEVSPEVSVFRVEG
jgi:hypothetical protein